MELRSEVKKLVDDFVEASREYHLLRFDDEYSFRLGKPCSPKQIAALEKTIGKPLPPSYRAFLELHNGFDGFIGSRNLLAVEDQGDGWVEFELKKLGARFDEFGDINPFKQGAIPVELGEDDPVYLVLDPRKVRKNGEMDFVQYEYSKEENRYDSFVSYLQSELASVRRLIEKEKKGTADE
jgi:hypothetical protein